MNQVQTQLGALLAPLHRLDSLDLGRPPQMTLSDYLQRLVQQSLISPDSASVYLDAYHRLRFRRNVLDDELLEQATGILERWATQAEGAQPEERDAWKRAFEPPPPEEPEESEPSDESEVLDADGSSKGGAELSETAAIQEASVKEAATAILEKSGAVGSKEKTTASGSTTPQPRQRRFFMDEAKEKPEESWLRRFFKGSLLSHLWWLVLVGLIGGVVLFYQGARNSSRVMILRYKIQNRLSRWTGFPQVTVPPRYLPRHMQPHYQRRRAVRRFTRYIVSRQPNNPGLWYRLASYYEDQDDYAKAAAFYARVISLRPNDAKAYNDLAWMLCTADDREYRDPIRGLALAKMAHKLKPKSADIVDTLAFAFYRNKQFKQAVEWQKKAIVLDPKDGELRQHLRRFRRALAQQQHKARSKTKGKAPVSKPKSR